jgi:hypothetical protein
MRNIMQSDERKPHFDGLLLFGILVWFGTQTSPTVKMQSVLNIVRSSSLAINKLSRMCI